MSVTTETIVGEHAIDGVLLLVQQTSRAGKAGVCFDLLSRDGKLLTGEPFADYPTGNQMREMAEAISFAAAMLQAERDQMIGHLQGEGMSRTDAELAADQAIAERDAWMEAELARGELAFTPSELPCPTCSGAKRRVVSLGAVIDRVDPTQTYELECGHSVI